MKTLVLSLLLTCISLSLSAETRTVSNKPGDVAQFTSVQEAVNASADGDIILISGSVTNYGSITIDKRLTLIGPGVNPKFNGGDEATLVNLNFTSNQASKSVLLGIQINIIYISASACDEVLVKRCQVSSLGKIINDATRIPQKWLIEESIIIGNNISNTQGDLTANWSIRNSYVFGTINLSGSILSNNVIYGGGHSGRANVCTNNIFITSGFSNITQWSFANNIFSNDPTIDFTKNSSSGNLFATDPQMVGFRTDFFGGDFTLKPGSPGINAGTDGKDIGMFGGNSFLVSGLPGIPSIESLVILNPTVPQNGTLNIKVEGKANN